jgi:hypothetical protein
MFHCLLIKMISQRISLFSNKKYHPNHNGVFKLTCLDWQVAYLMPIILGKFFTKNYSKKCF